MLKAVTMDVERRSHWWEKMAGWLRRLKSVLWGELFVRQLIRVGEEQECNWRQVSLLSAAEQD